ncbi:MAG TPA: RsmB/NOP family class I SAM-dependent RNA methyltransferase [Burkholderiales bacterium]|nr:RsmB/NOP family class I SAM-dependent RNA methyltransferase [Burkholderiales bacterium]
MRLSGALLGHAEAALTELLRFAAPADQVLSAYFRRHRNLGQKDRAFVAESTFAVLRRRRSLEAVAGTGAPRALLIAAALRVLGVSGRALEGLADDELIRRVRGAKTDELPPAVRADLPDWLWQRLAAGHGEAEAMRIAQGLLNPAPLDLRVNLARTSREEVLIRLNSDGIAAAPTPHSPAGVRLEGKPAINHHALFRDGLIEVQDEGSQLLAWLLAPRRGEMVADYCAGAGGKTLALAMLMRGAGRIYAMDISAKRLAALGPRAARAQVSNIHTVALSGENDARAKRLAGKLQRVLVDAPCSGFGTLRRNPDLKWRHGADAVAELARKQGRILEAAARLVKPGGRLVYATCSILPEENEAVADAFHAAHPEFRPLGAEAALAAQKILLPQAAAWLRLWPHVHGTDGFFAAVFERA